MKKNLMNDLSIDCVIFGFTDRLKVMLVKHADGISKGKWGLPGGWVARNESLDNAAYRLLNLLSGVKNLYLEQIKAFGDVDRFPERRVITIAYYSLLKDTDYNLVAGYTASEVSWFDISEIPNLIYDHNQILNSGREKLKSRIKQEPIGFNLLPEKFTLYQLQNLYESILEIKLDKPNFRRKILATGLLIDCDEKQVNVSHRAANLYKFDEKVYEELSENKFYLDW
jgi:hypothetical protein